MASNGIPPVLEMEVAAGWTPDAAKEYPRTHSPDGGGNPTWGESRISNELCLKLGIRVSPRTIGKYLAAGRPRRDNNGPRWNTFVRNHANGIVACEFLVATTASFRQLYVFVAMGLGSRRILHTNVTARSGASVSTTSSRSTNGI